MARQVTREELHEDAPPEGTAESVQEWLEIHYKQVLVGVLVLLVAILGLRVLAQVRESKRVDAQELTFEAQRKFLAAQAAFDRENMISNVDAARQLANEVLENYPGQAAAPSARFVLAGCNLLEGNYDEALAGYEAFLEEARSADEKAAAWIGIGNVRASRNLDDTQALEGAIEAFQKAREVAPEGYMLYFAMLEEARLRVVQGDLEEARALFAQVVEERPFLPEDIRPEEDEVDLQNAFQKPRDQQVEIFRDYLRNARAQFSFREQARRELERLDEYLKGVQN